MPEPTFEPKDLMMVQPVPGLPIVQIENTYILVEMSGATVEWKKLSSSSSSCKVTKGNKSATITLTSTVTKDAQTGVVTITNEQYTLTVGGGS